MELWPLLIALVTGPISYNMCGCGLSKAPRPGLERLLEARKRLQQLEEEKATGSDPGELHPQKLTWFT